MKNYVDYKTTVWQRAWFNNNANMNEVKEQAEVDLNSAISEELGFFENEIIYDTEEYINPEENNDCPTIEIYENDKLIWTNID